MTSLNLILLVCETRKFVMAILHWKQELLCDKYMSQIICIIYAGQFNAPLEVAGSVPILCKISCRQCLPLIQLKEVASCLERQLCLYLSEKATKYMLGCIDRRDQSCLIEFAFIYRRQRLLIWVTPPPPPPPRRLLIFVAFVEDNSTMRLILFFENNVSYFVQKRRKKTLLNSISI